MNTFLAILVLAFTIILTGCFDPKNADRGQANLLGLKIVCIDKAQYYYGRVSDTTIVTAVIGADGRGVHCQEFGN